MAARSISLAEAYLHGIFSKALCQRGFGGMYKVLRVQTHGKKLKKDEKLFSPTKDAYTMSSDASFDGSNFASIGVVIRKGVLPILCLAARIKCKTSHASEILGIALGLLQAAEIGILDLDVRSDCKEAFDFLKKQGQLLPVLQEIEYAPAIKRGLIDTVLELQEKESEEYTTAIKLVEEAHKLLNDEKYQIRSENVLRDENRPADHMACVAKTLEKKETVRVWEKKVPKGLKQLLIEDVAIAKVHFEPMPESDDSSQLEKFKLVGVDDSSRDIDHKKKAIVSNWFKVLAKEIWKREIKFILIRRRGPKEIYGEINVLVVYNWKAKPTTTDFDMLAYELQCLDVFKKLIEGGPKESYIEVYREFKKKEKKGKVAHLDYSREEIRLPACEMMIRKYDFGNFNMKATFTGTRKGSNIKDISEDLKMLQQIEEDSYGLEPRKLLKVEGTLVLT